jgi:hypothetical protein
MAANVNPAEALRLVCKMMTAGDLASAKETLAAAFPASPVQTLRSTWSTSRLVKVFIRDGFTDRYFGEPLVFPGTLRALSVLSPRLFPYHRNWKQSVTHPAYWTHSPTIDHVIPLAEMAAMTNRTSSQPQCSTMRLRGTGCPANLAGQRSEPQYV